MEPAMTSATDELIQRGLHAWAAGDLDALEAILDPAVTLRWVEPGDWDCVGRHQVIQLLRQRHAEGNAAYPVSIQRVDEHTFIVSSSKPIDLDGPQPFPVATRVTVADGKVTEQQYRTDNPGATAS
jgi:ketosteroid isomerase-like protein